MPINDRNASTIKRFEVTPEQEAYAKAVFNEAREASKHINKDSITPHSNNVVIRCKLKKSNLILPGQAKSAEYESDYLLYKVSQRIKDVDAQLANSVGQFCRYNLTPILALGKPPSFVEEDENWEYHYYVGSADYILYTYEKKA